MSNSKKERNALVEEHFRVALSTPDGFARWIDKAKDFINRLPDKDRAFIERAFGPDSGVTDAKREDLTYYTSGRLEEIEERYMRERGIVNW